MLQLGRKQAVVLAGLTIIAGSVSFPAAVSFASDVIPVREGVQAESAPAILPSLQQIAPPAVIEVTPIPIEEAAAPAPPPAKPSYAELDPELECMAKAIRYEAGNQSRDGQRAIAHIVLNRINSGRFPRTVCGVINQPGQFFRTASYNPPRTTAQWRSAVDIAREVMAGETRDVVQGAMFFHALHAANSWFRKRERVTQIGGHIFYR